MQPEIMRLQAHPATFGIENENEMLHYIILHYLLTLGTTEQIPNPISYKIHINSTVYMDAQRQLVGVWDPGGILKWARPKSFYPDKEKKSYFLSPSLLK